jgi:hypothetical protein
MKVDMVLLPGRGKADRGMQNVKCKVSNAK